MRKSAPEVESEDLGLEGSLNPARFASLFWTRLITQGLRATGLWTWNNISRLVFDRPIQHLSEITPQLYVGGQFKKRGWRILRSWGISAVVNMRSEFDDRAVAEDLVDYLHLPTADDHAPQMKDLQEGVEFIQQAIKTGRKVYVHCGSGVGRAPTMAAAYLVDTGLSPDEAWQKIRSVRCFIRPTRVQREQIKAFARLQR